MVGWNILILGGDIPERVEKNDWQGDCLGEIYQDKRPDFP